MKKKNLNLSYDIFCDSTGKKWTAVIKNHPEDGGLGLEVWRKEGMKSEYASINAMEHAGVMLQKSSKVVFKELIDRIITIAAFIGITLFTLRIVGVLPPNPGQFHW